MVVFFQNETFTRTVYGGAGYDSNGFPTVGSIFDRSITTFIGCLRPLNGKDLLLLPEGDRQTQAKKLYTETALNLNDLITRSNGENYEVIQSSENKAYGLGLDHYKYILQKVE